MARKQLNKNLVVVLTLVGFAMMILCAALMLQRLQQRDPKYFVELAERYQREEEWEQAALFYGQAWDRSHDATHLVAQGNMLLAEGEVQLAAASWQAALINQPELTEAHVCQLELLLELARLYGRLENWRSVQEATEAFLESDAVKTDGQLAFAHNANGLALVNVGGRGAGDLERGEDALRKARDLAPDNVEYALDLAVHAVRQGRLEDGEAILSDLIDRPTLSGAAASKVRVAFARHLADQRQFDEAERYFEEALSLAVNDEAALRDAKLAHALFFSQRWARAIRDRPDDAAAQGLFDQAEAILRECIDADPDDFQPYLHLAMLYRSSRRHRDVLGVCDARLQRGLSRKGVKAVRNQLDTFTLMIYASEACVAESVAAQSAGRQEEREAWLNRAEQYATDARGEFSSHPRVLSQAGRVKLARGMERDALEDLRAADEAYQAYDTIDWENKLILARLHLRLSEAGAAKAVLEDVLAAAQRRGWDFDFWTTYAQALLANNELDRAAAIADQVLLSAPDHEIARRIKAAVLERQHRPGDAGRLMTTDPVMRAILTAREHALRGEDEQAVLALREALKERPTESRLVSTMVRELLRLDREDEARTVIEGAIAAEPDNPRFQTLAVVTRTDLSADVRDEALLGIIEGLEDAYQRDMELIGFYVRKGDRVRALALIDEALGHLIAKDTPLAQNATVAQHRALLQAKLTIAAALGDEDALRAARDEAARYDVDGAGGKTILGLFHMHRKEFDLAVKAFGDVIRVDPTDAPSLAHLGQCLYMLGDMEGAQAAFERSIGVNPNEGNAHWGLALIAQGRGDREIYDKELETCRRLIPDDPRVRAALLARRDEADPHAAIVRREGLLADDPDDVGNLVRLAELCETVKDLAKADAYYARLLELRPDDKDVAVLVSKYFRRTDRPERSLGLVNRYTAARTTPADQANAHILIASHHVGLGDAEAAERRLLEGADIAETPEVCRSLAEFYRGYVDRPAKALPWLDKAAALAREAQSPRLARILAARVGCLLDRRVNDIEAARQSVAELRSAFSDDPRGLLLEAEIHARVGEIEEAVDSLTAYLALRPGDAGGLYRRARHYAAQGRLTAAIEDLEAAKRAGPLAQGLKPRFLLARLQRQAGRSDAWLRELESIVEDVPGSPAAIEAVVHAYVEAERPIDAERLVAAQINREDTEPDARWYYLRGFISLSLTDPAGALADFQRGASIDGHDAAGVTKVLRVYVQLGRAEEGLRYYEEHAPGDGPTSSLLSQYALLLAKADQEAKSAEVFVRAMELAGRDSIDAVQRVTVDLWAAFPPETAIALLEGYRPDASLLRAKDRILARLYGMAERYDEATTLLKRLIETCTGDRERGPLLRELGQMYQVAGDAERARTAYEEALGINGDDWVTLNNLAYLLSDRLGEDRIARPYAERAVVIADNPNTLDTLGWIYTGLGEYSLAIAELSRAVRLDPGAALSYYHLGEAYRRNGQLGEAHGILRTGRDLATTAGNADLVSLIEASLGRIDRSDSAP